MTFTIEWPPEGRFLHRRVSRIRLSAEVVGHEVSNAVVDRPAGGGLSEANLLAPSGPVTIRALAYETEAAGAEPLSKAEAALVLLPGDSQSVALSFESQVHRLAVSQVPNKATYSVGDEYRLVTTAYSSASKVLFKEGADFTYSSSNPSVATVDAAGNVKVVAAGTAIITVAENGIGGGGKSVTVPANGEDRSLSGTIEDLTGQFSSAYSVSADGSVAVGFLADSVDQYPRAFLWSTTGGVANLGKLGAQGAQANAVSADGSVLVGFMFDAPGPHRAFRWTMGSGKQNLVPLVEGGESWASAASSDGSVVVGMAGDASGSRRAVRWTAGGGVQDLGTLGGSNSLAYGVSADGSVVAGESQNAAGVWRAFRWTASGGMREIGTPGKYAFAYGISGDGSVVVGAMQEVDGAPRRAFRWTAAGGTQDLGTLNANLGHATATAASFDGSVVVGYADATGGAMRAFRWTASSGMLDLGTLGGPDSLAYGVSSDGSVVVGIARTLSGDQRAFRWVKG